MLKKVMFAAGWIACGLIGSGFFIGADHKNTPLLDQGTREMRESQVVFISFGVVGGPFILVLGPLWWLALGGDEWTLSGQPLPCTSSHPGWWCGDHAERDAYESSR